MSVTFPIETTTDNGVRVITCRRSPRDFETAAVFEGKLLTLLVAPNPIQAGKLHRLLMQTWGAASKSNLLDESQDAARFVERAPAVEAEER